MAEYLEPGTPGNAKALADRLYRNTFSRAKTSDCEESVRSMRPIAEEFARRWFAGKKAKTRLLTAEQMSASQL